MHGGMEGGYTYIDSSYPRRPGDIAKLSSVEFDPTGTVNVQIVKGLETTFNFVRGLRFSQWIC
jgi:hypothetical protein